MLAFRPLRLHYLVMNKVSAIIGLPDVEGLQNLAHMPSLLSLTLDFSYRKLLVNVHGLLALAYEQWKELVKEARAARGGGMSKDMAKMMKELSEAVAELRSASAQEGSRLSQIEKQLGKTATMLQRFVTDPECRKCVLAAGGSMSARRGEWQEGGGKEP